MDEHLPSVSLATYMIRVRKPSTVDEFEKLGNFAPGRDLRQMALTFLKGISANLANDDEKRSSLRIDTYDQDGATISGLLKTGEYGLEIDVVNTLTGVVDYTRKAHHADMYPFTFLLYLPQAETHGYVILQRFKNLGISETLLAGFKKYFVEQATGRTLVISAISPANAFKEIFDKGNLKRIRFIKHSKPAKIGQAVSEFAPLEDEFHIEVQAYAKRKHFLTFKADVEKFFGSPTPKGLIEVVAKDSPSLLGFEPDTIKVEVTTKRGKRTLNVTNMANLRSFHDISDEVKLSPSGFPTPDSVKAAAIQLLADLIDEHGKAKEPTPKTV